MCQKVDYGKRVREVFRIRCNQRGKVGRDIDYLGRDEHSERAVKEEALFGREIWIQLITIYVFA